MLIGGGKLTTKLIDRDHFVLKGGETNKEFSLNSRRHGLVMILPRTSGQRTTRRSYLPLTCKPAIETTNTSTLAVWILRPRRQASLPMEAGQCPGNSREVEFTNFSNRLFPAKYQLNLEGMNSNGFKQQLFNILLIGQSASRAVTSLVFLKPGGPHELCCGCTLTSSFAEAPRRTCCAECSIIHLTL